MLTAVGVQYQAGRGRGTVYHPTRRDYIRKLASRKDRLFELNFVCMFVRERGIEQMPIKLSAWFSDIRFLAILFVFEVLTLRRLSIQIYMPLRKSDLILDLLISAVPSLTKSFIISAAAGLVFFFAMDIHQNGDGRQQSQFLPRDCWLHGIGFIGLCLILILLRRIGTENLELVSRSLLVLTLPLWLGMLISWGLFFASFEVWRGILKRRYLGLIFIFTISFFSFFTYDSEIAAKLGVLLLEPTMALTNGLLAFVGEGLVFVGQSRSDFPLFRLQSFVAEIQPACSGYEGVLLTLAFLAVLLWRERYNAPPYVLISVLGFAGLATFLLNSVRIAVLFLVGAFLSPEVAQNGFHTNFGVLSLAISVGGAWLMLNYFIKQPAESWIERDPALLSLYPLILLTASSLVFGLFTGKFYWLYPLQCIMGAAGIYIVWGVLRFEFKFKSIPIILGAAVFLAWIVVVGRDPVKDEIFKEELFGVSPLLSFTWLIFRLFGAVIVVPVAEELAFRSLFWNLIMKSSVACLSSKWPAFFALCATSVAFGLLHSNIYAGFIAGIAYGLARLESGQVEDAIVAHMTTNFLLSIYVLATGHWSYW